LVIRLKAPRVERAPRAAHTRKTEAVP
jgi:hypothetical protein